MIDAGFEELDIDKSEFVVETLEFGEEWIDELKGGVVRLFGDVELDEAGLEGLSEERAACSGAPGCEVI